MWWLWLGCWWLLADLGEVSVMGILLLLIHGWTVFGASPVLASRVCVWCFSSASVMMVLIMGVLVLFLFWPVGVLCVCLERLAVCWFLGLFWWFGRLLIGRSIAIKSVVFWLCLMALWVDPYSAEPCFWWVGFLVVCCSVFRLVGCLMCFGWFFLMAKYPCFGDDLPCSGHCVLVRIWSWFGQNEWILLNWVWFG